MSRVQDVYPGDRVSLREVGLRDGLQLVKKFPTTAAKQRWIREEYAAGVRHFEVGSFLPAKTFPQFADVRDIVKTVAELPGAHGVALALLRPLSDQSWLRRGTVAGYTTSVRGLAFHIAGHELHHLQILKVRYLKR